MKAYHFLKADFRAGEGDEPPWEIGETRTVAEPARLGLCHYGYHFSKTLWDALSYAPGPLATLVEVPDNSIYEHDKGVAISRTLISAINIDRDLRLFACDCAERVLYLYETQRPSDTRPTEAIAVARRFANGQATQGELAAANAAAWAAGDAAGDAARAAANAAASAAGDAAGAAANAAAWAARAAASAAARAAAWAAGSAAWAWQRQHFNEIFSNIFESD